MTSPPRSIADFAREAIERGEGDDALDEPVTLPPPDGRIDHLAGALIRAAKAVGFQPDERVAAEAALWLHDRVLLLQAVEGVGPDQGASTPPATALKRLGAAARSRSGRKWQKAWQGTPRAARAYLSWVAGGIDQFGRVLRTGSDGVPEIAAIEPLIDSAVVMASAVRRPRRWARDEVALAVVRAFRDLTGIDPVEPTGSQRDAREGPLMRFLIDVEDATRLIYAPRPIDGDPHVRPDAKLPPLSLATSSGALRSAIHGLKKS